MHRILYLEAYIIRTEILRKGDVVEYQNTLRKVHDVIDYTDVDLKCFLEKDNDVVRTGATFMKLVSRADIIEESGRERTIIKVNDSMWVDEDDRDVPL